MGTRTRPRRWQRKITQCVSLLSSSCWASHAHSPAPSATPATPTPTSSKRTASPPSIPAALGARTPSSVASTLDARNLLPQPLPHHPPLQLPLLQLPRRIQATITRPRATPHRIPLCLPARRCL